MKISKQTIYVILAALVLFILYKKGYLAALLSAPQTNNTASSTKPPVIPDTPLVDPEPQVIYVNRPWYPVAERPTYIPPEQADYSNTM